MWPEIIAGAGQLIGGLFGMKGQQDTNAANALQAQKQMDFQERMSNTQYQRAVADMRAAGLNPALAYQQGGAGNLSGSSAQMGNALAPLGGGAAQAAQTAASIAQTRANIKNTMASSAYTDAQTRQLNIESAARLEQAIATATSAKGTAKYAETKAYSEARSARDISDVNAAHGYFARDLYASQLEAIKAAAQRDITSAHQGAITARLQQLLLPSARNQANFANTFWGKYFSPAMNDALGVLKGAAPYIK